MNTYDLQTEINQLHADICSALADPRRIIILYVLAEKSLNVSDLAAEVGISQPAASRHLKLLRERGLVQPIRIGVNVLYQLNDSRLIEALDLLRDVLRDHLRSRADLVGEID
jgi:DNA-binding transcriptional ArsR family regulator